MSRFFEFLQNLNSSGGRSAPDSGTVLENADQMRESNRILSVVQRPQDPGWLSDTLKASPLDDVAVEHVELSPSTRLVFHTEPTGAAADRFRLLRMRLRTLRQAGKLKTVLVTSPLPAEGKSTIALNLAAALAEGGKRRVLVIEGDLHHPSLNRQLGLALNLGLTDCLKEGKDPLSAIRKLEPLKFYLLPAGGQAANATELLQTEALPMMLQKLHPQFDWILIDAPPVIPLTDAVSLAHHTDATLVIARAGRTRQEALEIAISLLGRKRIVGIVLNGVDGLNSAYSQYAEYYRSDARLRTGMSERSSSKAATSAQSAT